MVIRLYNPLDPRVYSSLRSGTRMTEKRKRGHEDDIKEGHDKEGLCGWNDKGGWTLGSSPRVTEKRGYEGDRKERIRG